MKFKKITYIDRINFFSDFYIKYYRNIFDIEEFIFIVDVVHFNDISKYLFEKGFSIENIITNNFKKQYGFGERTNKQNEISSKYINQGFIVIYSDIDELVFHENLKEYILRNKENHICPKGLGFIQNSKENYFNSEEPIFSQRNFCKFDDKWLSKVCILKKPYAWTAGRHNKTKTIKIDNNIFLIDIGRICKKLMYENNIVSTKLYQKLLPKYTIKILEQIEKAYAPTYKSGVVEIPERIKKSNLFI
jgi:hypothetical protein